MKEEKTFYIKEPNFINVKRNKFEEFIQNYPRKLTRDVFGACVPPSVTYNDFELADRWPFSIVASTFLYDDNEDGYLYESEENREFSIMENYEEVFNSKTGYMANNDKGE